MQVYEHTILFMGLHLSSQPLRNFRPSSVVQQKDRMRYFCEQDAIAEELETDHAQRLKDLFTAGLASFAQVQLYSGQ